MRSCNGNEVDVKSDYKEVFVMPGGDRTGPMGEGSMTGRGAGNCVDSSGAGEAPRRGFGRGLGFGAGRGLGRVRGLGLGRARLLRGRGPGAA
ncbi:MAG: DUF5320 domain-containing protein [Coriobacteriia bacterium]